jgi:hypothetical protein
MRSRFCVCVCVCIPPNIVRTEKSRTVGYVCWACNQNCIKNFLLEISLKGPHARSRIRWEHNNGIVTYRPKGCIV